MCPCQNRMGSYFVLPTSDDEDTLPHGGLRRCSNCFGCLCSHSSMNARWCRVASQEVCVSLNDKRVEYPICCRHICGLCMFLCVSLVFVSLIPMQRGRSPPLDVGIFKTSCPWWTALKFSFTGKHQALQNQVAAEFTSFLVPTSTKWVRVNDQELIGEAWSRWVNDHCHVFLRFIWGS